MLLRVFGTKIETCLVDLKTLIHRHEYSNLENRGGYPR